MDLFIIIILMFIFFNVYVFIGYQILLALVL